MNPLTQIRNTQKASKAEIELGLHEKSSWHDRFKHSAYIFTGGLPFELTEGDVLAVFSQYGEIADIHLVRDKTTGAYPLIVPAVAYQPSINISKTLFVLSHFFNFNCSTSYRKISRIRFPSIRRPTFYSSSSRQSKWR